MVSSRSPFARLLLALSLFSIGLARPVLAERTVHVVIMACTDYANPAHNEISPGCTEDRRLVTNIFSSYTREAAWGVRIVISDLWGRGASSTAFWSTFEQIAAKAGPTDTVFVYFTGHGVIDEATKVPQLLACDEKFIDRDEIARRMKALNCKLRVLITDCCSSFYKIEPAEGDEEVLGDKAVRKLLLEHSGFTDFTAASPGQPAWATSIGGYMTVNLVNDLIRYPSWQQVFDSMRARVIQEVQDRMGKLQEPRSFSIASPDAVETPPSPTVESIIPDSSSRRLSASELRSMSLRNLFLARNEIFARHGYSFQTPFLQRYFSGLSWYRNAGDNARAQAELGPVEKANIDAIKAVERELGGPAAPEGPNPPRSEPPPPRPDPVQAGGDDGDIFPYSSQQLIPRDVLQTLSSRQLSLARNEIYARHGYIFKTAALKRHFMARSWYRPRTGVQPSLVGVEKSNMALIEKIERIRGGPYKW